MELYMCMSVWHNVHTVEHFIYKQLLYYFFLLNWINDNQITHINEQNGHSNIMCIAFDIVNEMTQMILELNIFWWVFIYGDDDLQ